VAKNSHVSIAANLLIAAKAVKVVAFSARRCANRFRAKTPIIKRCETCDRELVLKPSQHKQRYCSKECEAMDDIKRPLDWEFNGRPAKLTPEGYVMVWSPDHPNRSNRGWQFHHRVVVEQSIGRFLTRKECIHHINGVKDDNRIENLQIVSPTDHNVITQRELKQKRAKIENELKEAKAHILELERKLASIE